MVVSPPGSPLSAKVQGDFASLRSFSVEPQVVSSAAIDLRGLWHRFPQQAPGAWVLQNLDLSLQPGELLGLLGPSGCGKTTLLRLIAGLERPDRGQVHLDGRPVAGADSWVSPERRGVGMVFQDYALFPHLTAWQNACFGLRSAGRRRQGQERVRWLLTLVGLDALADRYPHELSGGQRQRLALVRALAPSPAVLLLDEPFSNLDVEVRRHLRSELPSLLKTCGTSGVLVTHDPEEALAICDRIAVLRDGVLQQCATPRELVTAPANPFVGRFVLQANLLPAQLVGPGRFQTPCGDLAPLDSESFQASGACDQGDLQVMVANDGLRLLAVGEGPGVVKARECLGRNWLVQVELAGLTVRVLVPIDSPWSVGERCQVALAADAELRLYPGGALLHPV